MNKIRRADIEKAGELVSQAIEILSRARDEEQEYYDAMPDGLTNGEKGERAQAAIDALQEACDSLDGVALNLEAAVE